MTVTNSTHLPKQDLEEAPSPQYTASICISVAFSYPIVFIGFRDGVLHLLNVLMSKHTAGNLNALSILFLSIITLLASFVRNLRSVNTVGGGTLGTVIVFVFRL